MGLDIQGEGEILTVKPKEDKLDIFSASELKDNIIDLFEQGRDKIIIDLSDISYIDSSGLGAIIGITNKAQRFDAMVAIAGINNFVKNIFENNHLDQFMPIFQKIEEAVDYLQNA